MNSKVRTLLIDDSGFMRIRISDLLRADERIDLIGTASNGKEGVEKVLQMNPDVVVTDMIMPEYDGLYVVKTLMKQKPKPIILLSSLERSDAMVFDALREGAIDFVMKPGEISRNDASSEALRNLIKNVASIQVDVKDSAKQTRNTQDHTYETQLYDLVAIGASTGGPGAIEHIVNNLPANLPIPVIIAQHMPSHFITTFAQRLNEFSPMPVHVATEGSVLKGGCIYIVSGEGNAGVYFDANTNWLRVKHFDRRFSEYNNPSVDCLFESVAETCGHRAIAVLLTGMGKDGAAGMKKIFEKGGITLAQDEKSSVVYGMPKAAVDMGAVKRTVALGHIPGYIVSCL